MSVLIAYHRESPLGDLMFYSFRDNKGVGSRFWLAHRKLRLPTPFHRHISIKPF